MLEIALCDDETLTVANMEYMLEKISAERNIEVNIDAFYDGSTLVDYITKGKRYDLIYLDIEMRKQNGVDAAIEIRTLDKKVLIIYVTNYESFAKDVFEVSAFRFIMKPIDKERFNKYFLDAYKELVSATKYFQYQYNKIHYRISITDIMYFQSDRRITYIITESGNRKCYHKLNDIEQKFLESNIYFYRVHQSFLVNPKFVSKYMYDTIELVDGTVLTISPSRRKKISKLFCILKGEDIIV